MVLKDDWDTGDSFTHSDANAVATQVNTNTTDISGKAASSHTHTASAISDSTTVGRNVLTAADAAAARSAIGAGTSSLALGTTNSTAKAGNYAPASTDISDSTSTGRAVLTAASQAAARSAIGAGTGSGDVTGQASSVDSEVALFSGTGGKTIKRATGSGLAKLTSGVLGTATAGTDYHAPGGTDVPVTDGGTGSSTASGARTNLGAAADADVVKLTGNQSIAGTKTFTDPSTTFKQVYINPGAGGGSAQFYLDNNVGDQWIIANDGSGTFKLYNVANNRSPIVVEDGAPGECLYLDASVVSTVLPLDMTSHKVINLANGSASGDAVNLGQLGDALVDALTAVGVDSNASGGTVTLTPLYTDTVRTAQAVNITGFTLGGTFQHGQKHMVQIKDNGSARTIAWTSSVIVPADGITLPPATVPGKTHLIGLRYDSVVGKLIAIAVGSY